jgi:membrane associated rhomboid family serine protease
MKCPSCSTELNQIESLSGSIIDKCPNCKGIWFDSDEFINSVRALAENKEISPQLPQLFKSRVVQTVSLFDEKDKICPRCNQKLIKFNYGYDSNVFLDKCTMCQGIWADETEIREIARYLKLDPRVQEIGKSLIEINQTQKDITELGNALSDRSPILAFMPILILPLGDEIATTKFPKINLSIIGLCVITYIYQFFVTANPIAFIQQFGVIPSQILQREMFYSLFTSMFLHGDFLHLLGNMFFLWIFGDNVEDRFSSLGYIAFYLACGVAANFMHIYFNASSTNPAIGASGAISGIMGAYLIFYPTARIKTLIISRIIQVPAFLWLGTWFLFQLIFGFIYHSAGVSNIAWFAHIGGFVFGGVVAYLIKKLA